MQPRKRQIHLWRCIALVAVFMSQGNAAWAAADQKTQPATFDPLAVDNQFDSELDPNDLEGYPFPLKPPTDPRKLVEFYVANIAHMARSAGGPLGLDLTPISLALLRKGPEVLPEVRRGLLKALEQPDKARDAELLICVVGRFHDSVMFDPVAVAALTHTSDMVRLSASWALPRLDKRQAVPLLVELLSPCPDGKDPRMLPQAVGAALSFATGKSFPRYNNEKPPVALWEDDAKWKEWARQSQVSDAALSQTVRAAIKARRNTLPPPGPPTDTLKQLYKAACDNMKLCSPLFAAEATNGFANLRIRELSGGNARQPATWLVRGDVLIEAQTNSMRVVRVSNHIMFNKYDSYKAQESRAAAKKQETLPSLDRGAAIERAKGYLKVLQWEVPPDFKLSDAEFDKWNKSRWAITWKRFTGQYEWDEKSAETECLQVTFHEKDGLDLVLCKSCFPPPKSVEVRLTKEQAIAKAAPHVETAQHIAMVSGYIATKTKSCVLKVAAPKYKPRLFGKMIHIEEGVPKETRLCWVVTFYVENPKTKSDKFQIALPGIPVIYIDAATGQVFGFGLDSSGK